MEDYDDHRNDYDKEYYTLRGEYHRLNGPAVIYQYGTEAWYCNGKRHRLDGPALKHAEGGMAWFVNGERHRLGGPAVIESDGIEGWYQNDRLHRDDGPAVTTLDGDTRLWVNGQEYDILEVKNGIYIRSGIVDAIGKLFPSLQTLPDYLFQISHVDMCLLRLSPYSIVRV